MEDLKKYLLQLPSIEFCQNFSYMTLEGTLERLRSNEKELWEAKKYASPEESDVILIATLRIRLLIAMEIAKILN
jgi:hypothetical protein